MKKLLTSLSAVLLLSQLQAQVGIGTPTPNSSAQLDITSTNKGFLMPRMTQAQRDAIASPATGLLIYQTDGAPGYYSYNGTAWVQLGGGSGWGLTGNAGTTGSNFIGTTDAQDLYFRVNNQPAGRIPNTNSGSLLLGYQAGLNNTGSFLTAIGQYTAVDNSADYVTAVGNQALQNNNTGAYNTGVGTFALQDNTSGGDNTAIGAWTMQKNTTGHENVAVGSEALR